MIRFERCALPVHSGGQSSALDQYFGRIEIRTRENGAVFSCVHHGSGKWISSDRHQRHRGTDGYRSRLRRGKVQIFRNAMTHYRVTERVGEAVRCVTWDASKLLDDGADVI